MRSCRRMERTPRAAAAALLSERAPVILPRVVAEATAGISETDTLELQRRLTAFLERRIPRWVEALGADDADRRDAIGRLIDTDSVAGDRIPPVVLLGTVAIGYRVIEAEVRKADASGFSPDEIWAEVDLLRRTVLDVRREISGGGRVA
jgi:hypothetical protein